MKARKPIVARGRPKNADHRDARTQEMIGANYQSSVCKIEHFSGADCDMIDNHEGQEAYSQTGSRGSLPDLWRGAGRKMRTHHGTPPYTAASRPTVACSGLKASRLDYTGSAGRFSQQRTACISCRSTSSAMVTTSKSIWF
jgi:hypothetical protein